MQQPPKPKPCLTNVEKLLKNNHLANEMLHESACGVDGLVAFTPDGMVVDGALDTPEFRAYLKANGVDIIDSTTCQCG